MPQQLDAEGSRTHPRRHRDLKDAESEPAGGEGSDRSAPSLVLLDHLVVDRSERALLDPRKAIALEHRQVALDEAAAFETISQRPGSCLADDLEVPDLLSDSVGVGDLAVARDDDGLVVADPEHGPA